jgi:hypothetical protein
MISTFKKKSQGTPLIFTFFVIDATAKKLQAKMLKLRTCTRQTQNFIINVTAKTMQARMLKMRTRTQETLALIVKALGVLQVQL